MLERTVDYDTRIPIKAYVSRIKEYPIHFHKDDLEIVVVMKGSIKIIVGFRTLLLKEGDVFIFNDSDYHGLYTTTEENQVLTVQINIPYFRKFNQAYDEFFLMAATYLNNERYDPPLEELKEQLFRITKAQISREVSDEAIETMGRELMKFLLDTFQYSFFTTSGGRHFINRYERKENRVQADRVRKVFIYIYENFDRKITLAEYADKVHISMYYLSHIIKDSTGLSFQELLSFTRVEASERLLLETTRKISEIALECGFSATRYYVKHFEKWFQTDPEQYRKTHRKRVLLKIKEKVFGKEQTLDVIRVLQEHVKARTVKNDSFYTKVIEIDLSKEKKRGRLDYYQGLEINERTHGIWHDDCDGLEIIKKRFDTCIPFDVRKDRIDGRIEEILSDGTDTALLIQYDTKILCNDHQFRKAIYKLEQQFCKLLCRPVTIYLQFGDCISAKERSSVRSQLKDFLLKPHQMSIREFVNHRPRYYNNNYLLDSLYAVPEIIFKTLNKDKECKFQNKLFDGSEVLTSTAVIQGDCGLMTANYLKKPAYYAYYFLAQLGKDVVYQTDGYIVTKDKGAIQILFYDYDKDIYDNRENFKTREQVNLLRELKTGGKDYKIEFSNIEGKYMVTQLTLDEQLCLFSKLADLQYPQALTFEMEKLLRQALVPGVRFLILDASQSSDIEVRVPRLGAVLLLLKKMIADDQVEQLV